MKVLGGVGEKRLQDVEQHLGERGEGKMQLKGCNYLK